MAGQKDVTLALLHQGHTSKMRGKARHRRVWTVDSRMAGGALIMRDKMVWNAECDGPERRHEHLNGVLGKSQASEKKTISAGQMTDIFRYTQERSARGVEHFYADTGGARILRIDNPIDRHRLLAYERVDVVADLSREPTEETHVELASVAIAIAGV